ARSRSARKIVCVPEVRLRRGASCFVLTAPSRRGIKSGGFPGGGAPPSCNSPFIPSYRPSPAKRSSRFMPRRLSKSSMPTDLATRPTRSSSISSFRNSAPRRIPSHSSPRPRSARNIKFRTLLHVLPYHNPAMLASQIAQFDMLVDGRYEFGLGRGHAWLPLKAGVPVEESRERYEEALKIVIAALDKERFSYDGKYLKIKDSHIVPRPTAGRKFRIFLGGTSDSTYELAGERGYAMVVPPLLPYEALRAQLDIYRASCAKHGNKPDIVWIHACHLDHDRDTAKREAEKMMRGFLKGNASV